MQEKLSNIIETVINNNKIKLVSNMSEIKDKDKLKKGEYSFKVKYFKKNIMPK